VKRSRLNPRVRLF